MKVSYYDGVWYSVLTLKRLVNNADSVVVLDNSALQRLSSEGGSMSGQSFDQTNQLVCTPLSGSYTCTEVTWIRSQQSLQRALKLSDTQGT